MTRKTAVCPYCGGVVRITTPKGGDRSAFVFYRHRFTRNDKELCGGSRAFVAKDEILAAVLRAAAKQGKRK